MVVFYDIHVADILKTNEDKTVSEPLVEFIQVFNNYNDKKKDRENNLIIFGLKCEKDGDLNQYVDTLLNEIGVCNFKSKNAIKLVKKGTINHLAPIKITLPNEETKYNILKAAKRLKEINERNKTKINISLDLNNIDRQINKKLLQEKKLLNEDLKLKKIHDYYYGIRNNRIVKIMIKNSA